MFRVGDIVAYKSLYQANIDTEAYQIVKELGNEIYDLKFLGTITNSKQTITTSWNSGRLYPGNKMSTNDWVIFKKKQSTCRLPSFL